ncbi:MAG TPA: hypothetical protein VIN10_00955 [Bacteroidales bacterium]
MDIKGLEKLLEQLDQFVTNSSFKGYDPYDFKDWIYKKKLTKGFGVYNGHHFLEYAETIFPLTLRSAFNIQPQHNAKAYGLLFASYLNIFKASGNTHYLRQANFCKEWLLNNRSAEYRGLSWGYPFDWKNTDYLITKNTPSSVVTAIVGDAFWKDFLFNGQKDSLEVCEKICQFFITELNQDEISSNAICFSYTPIDNLHVHNANLFVAEFLIKIGKETKNEHYVELGKKATNYTISEQNQDGSIYYWGIKQNHALSKHLDHYHSGYEIRTLDSIANLTGIQEYKTAFEKYHQFYLSSFFTKENFPKYSPSSLYPINIHSCAESILMMTTVGVFEPKKVSDLVDSINNKMFSKKGWYIYTIRKLGFFKIKTRIPYLRWGQAWMMRSLSEYYLKLSTIK